MTAILPKADTSVQPFKFAGSYSSSEVRLIKQIWTQTRVVAHEAMQLCLNLHQLKAELDTNDQSAGDNGTETSRFWAAFNNGDFPDYVTSNRREAERWLQAGAYAESKKLEVATKEQLMQLSPSTVVEISKISDHTALRVCRKHLERHHFIGLDATKWLSKQEHDAEVIAEVESFLERNETKPLVPSIFKRITGEVESARRIAKAEEARKARVAEHGDRKIVWDVTEEQIKERNDRHEAEQNRKRLEELIDGPSKAEHVKRSRDHEEYQKSLLEAITSLRHYKSVLHNLILSEGSEYLQELREGPYGPMGRNFAKDDVTYVREMKDLVVEIAGLMTTHQGPTKLSFDDNDLVEVKPTTELGFS